jgi:hypothetical protein
MQGSPEDAASTGDESSDIRTVRSNATHIFSQASYYTNPTLPASVLERLESDEISSLGGPGDYASPTSIMTNYESYSKFGAAPIYQTLPKATQASKQPNATTSKELKTISEESPAVYQAPSFYKSQRRTEGTRHGENISNIAISASKSIAASSRSGEDGSTFTEKTTTSSSRSSTVEDPVKPDAVKPSSASNTFSMMFKRITSSSKSPARNRNASPVPDISTAENKKGSPIAQSVRNTSKSARKSPPSSIVAATSTTNGRDSPLTNITIPKSIQVQGNSPGRPTTPTEPIRPSESQASTPKAGVHSPSTSGEAYINPTLKSVSSKLFVPEPTKRDPPAPQLNLAAVDGAASPKTFRLWTDEDSAIGATWYDFPQGPSFFASAPANTDAASPPPVIRADRLPPDTPSTLTTEAPAPTAKPYPRRAPPDTPSTLTAPEVVAPVAAAGPKLSLSRLQLKQMHRGISAGTGTITDEDTMNSRGGYPSMVSSEYEDEGGTYNGDTDDFTTLGGGPSLDFSVSACIDDESLKKTAALSPIVYSNVGQAFSRSDRMMPPPVLQKNAFQPGVLSATLDRPQRVRRNSSMSTSKHSSTLDIIEENGVPVATPPESDSSMVVVSIAEATHRSGRSSSERAPREKVVVLRKLDACQIGIIVLIGVALAAVICATFCIVGSCQVGGRRRLLLRGADRIPGPTMTGPVSPVDSTASVFSLAHGS